MEIFVIVTIEKTGTGKCLWCRVQGDDGVRAAQSAANELNQKLTLSSKPTGQIDGVEKVAQLCEEQIRKLQSFLNSI